MPTRVRYVTDGRGAYRTREYHFAPGDAQTVADDVAARLTERDDFETVETDGAELGDADAKSDRLLIEAGTCPWCDDYEGENVAQHASQAHPDRWSAYKDD